MSYDPRDQGAECDRCPLRKDRRGGPVPMEDKGSASVLVVGEAPAAVEVERGRPFMGPSGRELETALNMHGRNRGDVALTNVLLCRLPPKDAGKGDKSEMQAYLQKCKRAGLPSPVECCRPRLLNEMAQFSCIIPTGDFAAKAVTQLNKGILTLRGAPIELDLEGVRARVMPTVHPALTLPGRSPELKFAFQGDIGRAFRYFTDTLRWDPYSYFVYPTVEDAIAWMDWVEQNNDHITHDVETDSKYPLRANLRCFGMSTATDALTIPFLSVDGSHRYYSPKDEREIVARLKALIRSPKLEWWGWNSGSYDRIVIERLFGVWCRKHRDGIMGHRSAFPLMRHDLGTAGTTLSDVTNWKADEAGHKISKTDIDDLAKQMKKCREMGVQDFHWDAYWNEACFLTFGGAPNPPRSLDDSDPDGPCPSGHDPYLWLARKLSHDIVKRDAVLFKYNSKDNIVTERIIPPIIELVSSRMQDQPQPKFPDRTLSEVATHAQDMCVGMHRAGVYVNQERRGRAEAWLQAWTTDMRREINGLVGPWGKFGKVASDLQAEGGEDTDRIGEVTFSDSSTAAAYDFDTPTGFNPNSTRHMSDLLYERIKLSPKDFTPTGDVSVSDKVIRRHLIEDRLPGDVWVKDKLVEPGPVRTLLQLIRRDRKVRNKWLGTYIAPFAARPLKGESKLYSDGRVRGSWNAHGTPVWRYSCSDPGLQIIPGEIKPIYTPPPGHVFAGADADQIHLRIIACMWNVTRLIETFMRGADPHACNAYAIFGEEFRQAKGFPVDKAGNLAGKWDGTYFIPTGEGKWSGAAKNLRQIAKVFIYAFAYGAEVGTIYDVLIKAEDTLGRLVFTDPKFYEQVGVMRDKTLNSMPEFADGWRYEQELALQNGQLTDEAPWLVDPIGGVRHDFLGGLSDANELNRLRNARVLTAEAMIIHEAERRLLRTMPFEFAGPSTGPFLNCHDSLSVEVPELPGKTLDESGKWAADLVAEAMTIDVPGWPVRFTASGTFGYDLLAA